MKRFLVLVLVLNLLWPLMPSPREVSAGKAEESASYFQSGNDYFRQRDFENAAEAYRLSIELQPRNSAAYAGLGFAYSGMKRYAESVGFFQRAIALNPDMVYAHGGLGTALHMLGRYEESVAACGEAVRLMPDFEEAHYVRARSYLMLGMRDSAKSEYEILKSLNSRYADPLRKAMRKRGG